MKKLLAAGILLGAIVLFVCPVFGQNVWRVNTYGDITLNGVPFRVRGGAWFGLEGQYELASDQNNPRGAPMEQYMGNMWWQDTGRTYDQDINEIKAMGFNVVRLPLAPQTLDASDPQGREPYLKNAPSVRIANARLALETIIKKCNTAGLYVLLDVDSCSNYVGWRAGRLDARPPWSDASWDRYDLTRDDCSCAATGNPATVTRIQAYDVSKWLATLKTLAGLGASLNVTNIMGIDIFNEPWDYSWSEWKALSEQAYIAINSVNSNILIFVQGIGSTNGSQDGSPGTKNDTPHGPAGIPYPGENLYEAGANPPNMPKDRLVFSPHCYGPSVLLNGMFADPAQPECAALEGDAFGDAKCRVVIDPARLEASWEEHFGYLRDLGYAICIGEFGGNMDWPAMAEPREQYRYSYLDSKKSDLEWQTALGNYLVRKGINDAIYWALNPESRAYGIYFTAYEPMTNTGGWGTWQGTDSRKLNLLKSIWLPIPERTPTRSPIPTPCCSRTTPYCGQGDPNCDGVVAITDALLVAQYTAGMPVSINLTGADANRDGPVDIVDAMVIARYCAGLGWPN